MSDETKDVPRSTDLPSPKPTTEKVKNIAAIQGIKEPSHLLETKENSLQEAAKRADQFVTEHVLGGEIVEKYKLRGRIGEELAQDNIPGSINLNDVAQKPNIASYDLSSPHEMTSVKVMGRNDDGEPPYAAYRKYFRDIINPNSRANLRAAEDLINISNKDPEQWKKMAAHLPMEVANAKNVEQMASKLPEKGSLRISGDQVREVRDDIKGHCTISPREYGLDPNLDQETIAEQAQCLVRDHIKPIDQQYDFSELDDAARDILEQRMVRKP